MAPLFGQRRKPSVEEQEQQDKANNDESGNNSPKSEHCLNDECPSHPPPPPPGEHHRNNVSFTTVDPNSIRKYLVLLQDCLAIKFVPIGTRHPFGRFENGRRSRTHFSSPMNGDHHRAKSPSCCPETQGHYADPTATMVEVDHTLHGLHLYKGFRESNLQCYWNSALYETIHNMEYKGYLVPSTILVTGAPKTLAILRTAWARQMLRSPQGYTIEFLGEIEELIAEPAQQGQFAPLSDSLCWAILEITSMGQEAFVDSILMTLTVNFPGMVIPNRELVFQTLEKLIRERKIYQTNRGYFVVTPDTFRYMASTQFDHYGHPRSSNHLTLDALLAPHLESDKLSFSHHSWDSGDNANLPLEDAHDTASLKRHSSLKTFRQKDLASGQSNELGGRSLSLRMTKSKSLIEASSSSSSSSSDNSSGVTKDKHRSSTLNRLSKRMSHLLLSNELSREKVEEKTKSKSFLSKLFPFRRSRSKSRNEKSTSPSKDVQLNPSSSKSGQVTSQSTQTFSSQQSSEHLPMFKSCEGSAGTLQRELNCTSNSSDELYGSMRRVGIGGKWNSLPPLDPLHFRPGSRRSISILDDHSPLYDTLSPVNRPSISPGSSGYPGFQVRGESSRCSTLSQGASSLGYGSQGPNSLTNYSNSNSHSPCPSGSASATYAVISPDVKDRSRSSVRNQGPTTSYRSSQDFYRRRYPSYNNQFGRGSHQYSSLNVTPRSRSANRPVYETIGSNLNKTNVAASCRPSTSANVNTAPQKKSMEQQIPQKTTRTTNSDPVVTTTTTTVTQNVKQTTNMELEVLLPVGKIMSAALAAKRAELKGNKAPGKITVNLESTGAQVKLTEPKTTTEFKTTIVENNGCVQTHFDCISSQAPVANAPKPHMEVKHAAANLLVVN